MKLNPNVVRSIFTVKEKQYLSPHFIRIIFEATEEQLNMFRKTTIGRNNKIFIPPTGIKDIHFPDNETSANSETTATMRTYTTRMIDFKNKELWIDFVVHGDEGIASIWAENAKKGDILGIAMKESNRPLIPKADNYLLVGDATAVPFISAVLEQLPKGTSVKAILEVHSNEDGLDLHTEANLTIKWIYNLHPEKGSDLAEETKKELALGNQKSYVYIAAEYATAKELRNYFSDEKGWDANKYTSVSYWKSGISENQPEKERKKL